MTLLRLHVWGPAFGLASIDAECLAAIAYFCHSARPCDYELVATSPSAVPTNHLPALHNTLSDEWASGYQAVLALLHASAPSPSPESGGYDAGIGRDYRSLDEQLSLPSSALGDSTTRTAFLTAHAAPLLALSLYVSSANWVGTTRPAFSELLPFPLGWTEGPARRRAMSRRAEHLNFSDLDTDRDAADSEVVAASKDPARTFIPARLQPRSRAGIAASMTPEVKARFRLEAAAASVLDVLASCVGTGADVAPKLGEGWLRGPWAPHQDQDQGPGRPAGGRPPSSFECLAFGYLALMAVPTPPRPWLREVLGQKYPDLVAFVDDARAAWFPVEPSQLPWVDDQSQSSVHAVVSRLAAGCMMALPAGVGVQWSAWRQERRLEGRKDGEASSWALPGSGDRTGFLNAVCTGVLGASAAAAGAVLYRSLQPFGLPTHRFEGSGKQGLWAFGAAGAALGLAAEALGGGP